MTKGKIKVNHRPYVTPDRIKVKINKELGLAKYEWLSVVLELACALGISDGFPNFHRFF